VANLGDVTGGSGDGKLNCGESTDVVVDASRGGGVANFFFDDFLGM